jgi:Flp pilus assembly protein TadG
MTIDRSNLFRRSLNGQSGQSLIESAICIPVLLILFFCFMETCLLFYTKDMISEAAREGTRYAMFRGSGCKKADGTSCTLGATDINAYVKNLGWPNIAGGVMTPNTTYPDGVETSPHPVQVTVTYKFPIIMPLVPNNAWTLTSTSVMTILE